MGQPSGIPAGRVMPRARRKDPGGMRLTQLKKLSFPFLLTDYVSQNMFLVLNGVAWREMSVGSWNSTKPRLKGVFCKVSLDLETGSPATSGWGKHAGSDY